MIDSYVLDKVLQNIKERRSIEKLDDDAKILIDTYDKLPLL